MSRKSLTWEEENNARNNLNYLFDLGALRRAAAMESQQRLGLPADGRLGDRSRHRRNSCASWTHLALATLAKPEASDGSIQAARNRISRERDQDLLGAFFVSLEAG